MSYNNWYGDKLYKWFNWIISFEYRGNEFNHKWENLAFVTSRICNTNPKTNWSNTLNIILKKILLSLLPTPLIDLFAIPCFNMLSED